LRDPFAEKRRPWGLCLVLLALLAGAALWFFGRIDCYLPTYMRAQEVLGRNPPPQVQSPVPPAQAEGTGAPAQPVAK
jgi:hypothetical protein